MKVVYANTISFIKANLEAENFTMTLLRKRWNRMSGDADMSSCLLSSLTSRKRI